MKKRITLAACLLAGAAVADVDIQLSQDGYGITKVNSSGSEGVDYVLAQLIWSATAPTYQGGADASLGSGEFLLSDYLTAPGDWGTFDAGVDTYYDTDVGNNDINNGYYFVRLYDNEAKAQDDWYLQFNLRGPTLKEFDTEPRPPHYVTADDISNLVGDGQDTIDLNDANYGHQAIPEPAVASLIGIFGGGLIITRRVFSKKA